MFWLIVAAIGAVGVGAIAHEDYVVLIDAVLAVAGIALFLKWPYAMLLVIVAAAYKDNQVLELLAVVGGAVAVAVRGRRGARAPLAICLFLLLVIALPRLPLQPTFYDGFVPSTNYVPFTGSRIPYVGEISSELVEWWRLAFLLVAFMLGAWLIRDRRRLGQVVAVSLVGAVIPVEIGLRQFAAGNYVVRTGTTQKAIQGPFSFPNPFAFFLLTTLVVGLITLLETRSARVRAALIILLAGAGTCFFLTYTRSAWIGFAAALLILGVFHYRWMVPVGSVVLVIGIFAFPGAVNTVQSRFNNPASYSWRTGEWSAILPYGLHHPLTGTGFGSYQEDTVREFGYENLRYPTIQNQADPVASPKGFTAHNDYVRMLVELGYPGLVLWSLVLLFLLASLVQAARAPGVRPLAVGVGAVVAALIVISYADNVQAYTTDLLYPLVLAGGLATVARVERGGGQDAG